MIHDYFRQIIISVGLALAVALPWRADGQVFAPGSSLPSNSPFRAGVPTGTATPEPIAVSIGDAIRRALEHNLGVLQAEESVNHTAGAHWLALSELLPNLSGSLNESRQKVNLEAFGFPLGDEFPRIVGPFNLFDARLFLKQSVFDKRAINNARAESHSLAAARHSYRSARDLVVLVGANLYLQALATGARAVTARAQFETAEALYRQAQNLRQGGIVAGIDVVRAEVRLSTDRQRTTAAENDFQKTKLQLARVMGLPIRQEFTLSDELPTVPIPEMTLDEALERAYRERPDYLAAQERVRAAEAKREAALSENLPSVTLNADYGVIGLTVGAALPTFSVTGNVHVPIFEGRRSHGRLLQANADLNNRRAESEDLRAEIYYDVRSAFLDLQATDELLQAANRSRDLSSLQLTQARDRFAAGVANNIEVIQAQEAVTLASEQYIAADVRL